MNDKVRCPECTSTYTEYHEANSMWFCKNPKCLKMWKGEDDGIEIEDEPESWEVVTRRMEEKIDEVKKAIDKLKTMVGKLVEGMTIPLETYDDNGEY